MLKLLSPALLGLALLVAPAAAAGSAACPGFTLGPLMTASDVFVEDSAAVPCADVESLVGQALRDAEYDAGAWLLGGGDVGCGISPAPERATLRVRCTTASYLGADVTLQAASGKRCRPTHYGDGEVRGYVLRDIRCAQRKRLIKRVLAGRHAAEGDRAITRVRGMWCYGRGSVPTTRWICAAGDGRAARFVIRGG
jgi:hypothetical protein